MEMGRIFEQKHIVRIVKETWTKIAGKILEQVDIEKHSNSRLRTAIQELLPKNSSECRKSLYCVTLTSLHVFSFCFR